MTEIIRKGHYEKTVLCFRCNRCGTEFRTDEYFILHQPVESGKTEKDVGRYFYTHCPICKHSITHMVTF